MSNQQYRMAIPSADGILKLIKNAMGPEAGVAAWRTACEAAGHTWPGVDDHVETLMAVLEKMTLQSGLAETVARSGLIRLHSWNVLSKISKVGPAEENK